MPIKHSWSLLWAVAFFASVGVNAAHAAPLMIVGNDEKLLWDDNSKPIISPAGKDSVLIVDLAEPENPKIVANLPLKNSVVGPPVNVAIDPMNSVALVADSIDVIRDGDALKMGPDNKVYVIDLKANPPKHAGTITVGKQPSGLSFNSAGNLALVTNRADKSVSVLSVKGTNVKVIDTIEMGGIVSHAVFTPDGKRIIFSSNYKNPHSRNFDLFLVNSDGTGLEQVTTHPEFDGFPMFSPNGKQLVWAANRFGSSIEQLDIYIADWVP